MPVPLPNLDDRRWADLVEEGRALIPRYAPAWTDHNASDPGITLVELFAWLAEMAQYRLNRVPSRHRRKFATLVGFELAGPRPAEAMLSFQPAPAAPAFPVEAGTEFEGTAPGGSVIAFRTLRDITVSQAVLREVRLDFGDGTLVDRTQQFFDGLPLEFPGALYLGFDPLEPGVPLALGFRFAGPGNDSAERLRILEEAEAQAAACRPVVPRFRCVTEIPVPPPGLPPHHSARLDWEVFTTAGWAPLPANDETRSFTLDGIVEVVPPVDIQQTSLGGAALYCLRARLTEGALDAVPVLLDIEVNAAPAEEAVPVRQLFPIGAGVVAGGPPPSPGSTVRLAMTADERGVIQSLTFGAGTGPSIAVWAYTPGSAITLGIALAGFGTGRPEQKVSLRDAPVDLSTVQLFTHSGTDWHEWTRRNDFDASSREDYHFVLDATTGEVQFGNGERGRAPEAGDLLLASYRTTAGAAGNLDPGQITRPRHGFALNGTVTNRSAARGGVAAETLAATMGRAVETLHAHQRLLDLAAEYRSTTLDQVPPTRVRSLLAPSRAVNLIDLERIALSVPGARIARARAWASHHPSYPCLQAPGVVTLVVVPEAPPGMPVPSPGLLTAVWRYLNRRRLVTTAIQVVGPEYVEVTVTARVRVRTGASAAKLAGRVRAALENFLNPLTGGPDALGWPFGRSVFRSEIMQLIDGVPGVDHVVSLSMATAESAAQCGDVALCPTALVRSGAHSIEVV